MSFGRNERCPCGRGRKFKQCCGKDANSLHDLHAAVHEIGHAAVLPKVAKPHVSFANPCDLCAGDEGEQLSRAHNGYAADVLLTAVDEIMYSMAGGAAEIACGLSPTLEMSEFGMFPVSMGGDLPILKDRLNEGGLWEHAEPFLSVVFKAITAHFEEHKDTLWENARRFLDRRVLTSDDMDLQFLDREALLKKIGDVLGIKPPPPEAIRD